MNKIITALLLIFLLSLGVCGCANHTPEASKTSYEETTAEIDPTALPRTVAIEAAPSEDENIYYNDKELIHIEKHFLSEYSLDGQKIEQVYDSSQLSREDIEGRNGRLIAERCIGIVTDAQSGAGRVLNPYDEEYDYISFSRCNVRYKNGTVIASYLVYNPETDWVDDVIDRYDFVLTREYEN